MVGLLPAAGAITFGTMNSFRRNSVEMSCDNAQLHTAHDTRYIGLYSSYINTEEEKKNKHLHTQTHTSCALQNVIRLD